MASTETSRKHLIIRWIGRKNLTAILLFFILVIVLEALMIYNFQTLGLSDPNLLVATLLIPYANWSTTISISPLFHLLPAGVIVVLLSSWIYLAKYIVFIPQRMGTQKRSLAPARHDLETRRFKSIRRFSRRITRRLERIGRALKSGAQRIRGVSYISHRLFIARATVRSAAIVVLIFLSAALLFSLIEYPNLIHSWTVNLYKGSPAFLNFVSGTAQWFSSVGRAVPALGGFGSAINDALIGASAGFRHSLTSAGTSLSASIVQLDVQNKYILSQNVAAWFSALFALAYGSYVSSRPSRRTKGR